MHFSTLLLSFTLALTAAAEPLGESKALPANVKHAVQYKREPSSLSPRTDTDDPKLYCGDNYEDCGNGWCCTSGSKCAGKLYDIPVCKDPTNTFTGGILGNTEPAIPYKDPEAAYTSLSSVLAQITAGKIPTQGSGATNTGAASANSKPNNGATLGGPSTFGQTAGLIGAIWGVAALGGAGFFLL